MTKSKFVAVTILSTCEENWIVLQSSNLAGVNLRRGLFLRRSNLQLPLRLRNCQKKSTSGILVLAVNIVRRVREIGKVALVKVKEETCVMESPQHSIGIGCEGMQTCNRKQF